MASLLAQLSLASTTVDLAALEALYEALGGPHWETNFYWMHGNPCDDENPWTGVFKNGLGTPGCTNNRVIGLNLYKNLMSGTIPTEIGNLGELQYMSFNGNFISGTIPSEIGLLTKLRRVALHNNRLEGTVPSELGALPLWQCFLQGPQCLDWGYTHSF